MHPSSSLAPRITGLIARATRIAPRQPALAAKVFVVEVSRRRLAAGPGALSLAFAPTLGAVADGGPRVEATSACVSAMSLVPAKDARIHPRRQQLPCMDDMKLTSSTQKLTTTARNASRSGRRRAARAGCRRPWSNGPTTCAWCDHLAPRPRRVSTALASVPSSLRQFSSLDSVQRSPYSSAPVPRDSLAAAEV